MKRPTLIFLVFCLVAALVTGLQAASTVKTLAILPFENNAITEPERYEPLSSGLAAMLITDLNRYGTVLKVIERNKIKSILKEIALGQTGGVDQATAIEAGRILGAQSIGFGSFTVMGEMVRIDMRIINVETSELIMAEAVNGQVKDFLALELSLAEKIADALKMAFKSTQAKTKSSIDAALHFSKGIDALDRGDNAAATTFFNQAIALDPGYRIQVQAIHQQ